MDFKSLLTFLSDSEKSDQNWKRLVTELRQDSLARRKSAHLKKESGSSSWPTAKTPTGGSESRESRESRGSGGEDLEATAKNLTSQWQTPATDSFRSRGHDRKDEMGLDQQARLWQTPTTRDWKSEESLENRKEQGHTPSLSQQVYLNGLQDHQIEKPGDESSKDGQTSPPRSKKLNPRFVCFLMGFQVGWTEPWDTE